MRFLHLKRKMKGQNRAKSLYRVRSPMSLQIPRKDKDFQLLFPVFICTRNVKTYMKTKRHKKAATVFTCNSLQTTLFQ